jgi:hypothetical protein
LVDILDKRRYNKHMNKTNETVIAVRDGVLAAFDEILQWVGAVAIIAGHVLNAIGPSVYPYNILVFAVGTVAFLIWALRVANKPQAVVNVVSLTIGIVGLIKSFG